MVDTLKVIQLLKWVWPHFAWFVSCSSWMLTINGTDKSSPCLSQHSLTLSSCSFMMSQVAQEWTWSYTWMLNARKAKCFYMVDFGNQALTLCLEIDQRATNTWVHCELSNRKLGVNWGHISMDQKDKPLLDDSENTRTMNGTDLLLQMCLLYFNHHCHAWTQVPPAMPWVDVLRVPDGVKKGLSVWVPPTANLHLENKERVKYTQPFYVVSFFQLPKSIELWILLLLYT